MDHLIRLQFLDLSWQPSDLRDAAAVWLQAFEIAYGRQRAQRYGHHQVEIRLSGFPRHDAETLERALRARLEARRIPAATIDRPDADTLALTLELLDLGDDAMLPEAVAMLFGEPFAGLMIEARFLVGAYPRGPSRDPKVVSTLVLVGELGDDSMLLKAAWRTGFYGWEDRLHWAAPWENEQAWLDAIEDFRAGEAVPGTLANRFFPARSADWIGRLAVRLISVPLDRPRLLGLLMRLLVFVLAIGLGGYACFRAYHSESWIALLIAVLWLFFFGWLFLAFASSELRLIFVGFAMYRRGYARIYAARVRLVAMPADEAVDGADNPYLRKYEAELLHAGCTPAGRYRLEPESHGKTVIPIFFAPDGNSHVLLMALLATTDDEPVVQKMWPCACTFMVQTFFQDGGRLTTVNGTNEGFRRKRTGPQARTKVHREVTDPAELLQRHASAVDDFATETNRRPQLHSRIEDFLRRHDELVEEERLLFEDDPYDWGDHRHWYLQKVRREYR